MKAAAMFVKSYPVGEAARQYAADVKPVLVAVAKRLGYAVGTYSGHGCPCTVLRCTDAASPVDSVVVYWRGYEAEAGVRSREWRRTMQTGIGRIAHAMSMGVHEAYGSSAHADLAARIEQAITNAVNTYEKEQR
jgi:hypothetical protein